MDEYQKEILRHRAPGGEPYVPEAHGPYPTEAAALAAAREAK